MLRNYKQSFVCLLFSGLYLSCTKALNQRFDLNFIKQGSILCTIGFEILLRILKFLPPTDVVHLSHTCKQLYQELPFYLVKSGHFMITASKKANPSTIWFEGLPINFFVSKMNVLIAFCYVGKIVVWIQIIRNGKVIIESKKYHTGSGGRESNIQFEENDTFLREYRPGDRIRFIACLPVRYLQKSINCTFQVSLQLKHYTYGKPLYAKERGEFITHIKGTGYFEYNGPDISMECPDVANCFPRVDYLPLLSLPNDSVTGNTYFWIIEFLNFGLDYRDNF